jgi:hypothetical protein
MQVIAETIFNPAYIVIATFLGISILRQAEGRRKFVLFGWMTIILVVGDAFHVLPRVYGHHTVGLENLATALGFGTLVASITMTIFYLLLYLFWRIHYNVQGRKVLSAVIYVLSAVRIGLCLLPQNQWFIAESPVIWGGYRNIPFTIMGAVIAWLFFKSAQEVNDRFFKKAHIAIILSFLFYIPVVLFAGYIPIIGALMLPKTIMYVWIVFMGYKALKSERIFRHTSLVCQ